MFVDLTKYETRAWFWLLCSPSPQTISHLSGASLACPGRRQAVFFSPFLPHFTSEVHMWNTTLSESWVVGCTVSPMTRGGLFCSHHFNKTK